MCEEFHKLFEKEEVRGRQGLPRGQRERGIREGRREQSDKRQGQEPGSAKRALEERRVVGLRQKQL